MKSPKWHWQQLRMLCQWKPWKPSCFQVEMSIQSIAVYFQINLRLILVSGKTKEFLFSPNDSASDIAKHVYDNWPMDWEEEQVSSPNILRLIYQGRFLHGNVTLGALKLPFGKTTVMHLVARETLPEPNSQGQRNREKTGESNCCVILWRVASTCRTQSVDAAGTEEVQQRPTPVGQSPAHPWGWITWELCHLFL